VRDYAAAQEGMAKDEIAAGMAAKSAEFRAAGGEIYIPVHKA
jgi:phosphomethylpyrimidine synthase